MDLARPICTYTRDHLGSVREAVDAGGNLQARYDYDLYGQQTALTENIPASFGFSGHFAHRPSGLDLTLLRALDPRLGRWLSRDPVGEAAGLNLYAYVGNDPINAVDLFGNDKSTQVINAVGNFVYGWGNTVSFGIGDTVSTWVYGLFGACTGIDKNSDAYKNGKIAGIVTEVAATGGYGAYRYLAARGAATALASGGGGAVAAGSGGTAAAVGTTTVRMTAAEVLQMRAATAGMMNADRAAKLALATKYMFDQMQMFRDCPGHAGLTPSIFGKG